MMRMNRCLVSLLVFFPLVAQDPSQLEGLLRNAGQGHYSGQSQGMGQVLPQTQGISGLPLGNLGRAPLPDMSQNASSLAADQERINSRIRAAKARERGAKRFAADLFDVRQVAGTPTDGGISADYVLGMGDQVRLNLFGSATQEFPVSVDGRGTLVIPGVGRVSVAGLSLDKARAAVEAKVREVFSRTTVDLSVTKLREVRVFVLGEVYAPGGYLVPSLGSLINVLGLAGGPAPTGSFRDIRVLRGGKVIHSVDLYPLRADGIGNFNFGFQNGDTIFVPLIHNQVRLEGAFTRVAAQGGQGDPADSKAEPTKVQKLLLRRMRSIQAKLGVKPTTDDDFMSEGMPQGGALETGEAGKAGTGQQMAAAPDSDAAAKFAPGSSAFANQAQMPASASIIQPTTPLTPAERATLEDDLELLREQLAETRKTGRADFRIEDDPRFQDDLPSEEGYSGQPGWISAWLKGGKAPALLFEMNPGETVQDAIRFAGGIAFQGFADAVSVRRMSPRGSLDALDVPSGAMGRTPLERGDVVTALPLRDSKGRFVQVSGWSRTQGVFARQEGDRVGALIARNSLVLPDTYLQRGELVRTLEDGSRQFTVFNVAKALKGEEGDSPLLQDRDEVVLYRIGDVRLPRTLTVVGPVSRPGTFEFLDGMRVSDLLFRAGVPLRQANRFTAELSRVVDGKPGRVFHLDLARLISTEDHSPVDLKDDAANPRLEPYDQLSIYAKPDFRAHRTVTLSGQVVRPGVYELDAPHTTLQDVLARAGGFTPEAMPNGGVFLRTLGAVDPGRQMEALRRGGSGTDPASRGANEVLNRLNETKRMPTTGMLLSNPLLHGLAEGNLNRLIVDFPRMLAGDANAQVEMQDGDEVLIPRRTEVAYVVGETASPFAAYKATPGMTVKEILRMAGGPTRNADTWSIRLMKADGRIVDHWVNSKAVEPGDTVLVPQRIRRDTTWQENLSALTPLAILINTFK